MTRGPGDIRRLSKEVGPEWDSRQERTRGSITGKCLNKYLFNLGMGFGIFHCNVLRQPVIGRQGQILFFKANKQFRLVSRTAKVPQLTFSSDKFQSPLFALQFILFCKTQEARDISLVGAESTFDQCFCPN